MQGIVCNLSLHDENTAMSSLTSSSALPSSNTSASCETNNDSSLLQAVFAEGVQGRLNFQCKGPRLNVTKEERLSSVYAPDNRLCWSVIGPMPKLLVCTWS